MKQTKLNFNGVAVLCSTWQQMLHLAELAREQGYKTEHESFNENSFNEGDVYFHVGNTHIWNLCSDLLLPVIPYTTFINPPVDDSVYGC
jgi:hypothetical protein